MASLSPTTAPISVKARRSGSVGFSGCGADANSTDATTARCGGRREAEKIGRSWVADNTDSGTDHRGLPAGNDLAVSRLELAFGLAIGVTRPISTLSGASTARSVEMTSSVEEVAAGTCGEKTTNTPPDS